MEFLYRYASPGILTLILGLLAAMTALPKATTFLQVSWWRHAAAIFIFCSIAAAEIAVIHHADQVSDQRFGTIFGKFQETQGLMAQYEQSLEGKLVVRPVAPAISKPNAPQQPKELVELKQKAASVSQGILKLLVDRLQGAPPWPLNPQSPTWDRDMQERINWDDGTVAMYHQQFGVAARETLDALAKYGLKDQQATQLAVSANNIMVVRMVAYRLGCLAELGCTPF